MMPNRVAIAPVLLAALAVAGGCTGSASTPPPPPRVLLIVDLSPSLTMEQKRRITSLAVGYLQRVPSNARFAIYALQLSIGSSAPLLAGKTPVRATTNQKADARTFFTEELRLLDARMEELVAEDARRRRARQPALLNSCYIDSAEFAGSYFATTAAATPSRLAWIGDLVEDCRTPPHDRYRLTGPAATTAITRIRTLPVRSLFPHTEVTAAMIPRQTADGLPEVDAKVIQEYWRELAGRLGVTPARFSVGNVDALEWLPAEVH